MVVSENPYYLAVEVNVPVSIKANVQFGRASTINRTLILSSREEAVDVLSKVVRTLGESATAGNAYISDIVDDIKTFCLELCPKIIMKAESFYIHLDFSYAYIKARLVPCKHVTLEGTEALEPCSAEATFFNLASVREFVKQ